MPGRDTKTRYQGVFARHQERCKVTVTGDRRDCSCTPSYYGAAWDREAGKPRKTRRVKQLSEARNARSDLLDALGKGELAAAASQLALGDAFDKFVQAARDGVALNKWRRRYRPRAVEDLASVRPHLPEALAGRRPGEVKRGELQALVDKLSAKGLSGSRIRSIINALRAFYTWAQDHELAGHDPAQRVKLPATDAKPRDRVATPSEFVSLLRALSTQTPEEREEKTSRTPREALRDCVPFALAAYATARRQEIQVLDWRHVDLDLGAAELAADEEGRKPGGSWRVVPLAAPLRSILREEWLAQGRPKKGKVCPPLRQSKSGLVALSTLQTRVHKRWSDLKLAPIGLQEARHTAATWLDHAGVSPKVASQIMGHKTPEYQTGAARITLERYTHVLPGELEHARELLDKFLADRLRDKGPLKADRG
jgi:integrase